jgi:small subunit ribosomal protein S1
MERERFSLSLKATQADPWKEFESTHRAGQVIEGEVTKLVPFGAFVRVAQGIEGLVHISKLSDQHVESADQVVQVGDRVRVRVEDVDVSRRRVSLSMRGVSAEPEPAPEIEAEAAPGGPEAEAEPVRSAEPEPEPPADLAEAEPAEPEIAPEPEPEPATEEEPGEVSLESIVEELKRREGRT